MLLNKPCNEGDVPHDKIIVKYPVSTVSKSIIIVTVHQRKRNVLGQNTTK